ncbi:hypothetical protein [Azospirillum sp. TSA6c]|uniref:hypothetical protein n=1 Tax=unclassified Azospirillum TaxID=2630922 RepID=UPI000D613225|nr:hypothetical protein [Azospirillum sp. TSA6c]PWC47102.1 hypothetical protein TSA6c_10395 [Azospirillum sp. TSA6c]
MVTLSEIAARCDDGILTWTVFVHVTLGRRMVSIRRANDGIGFNLRDERIVANTPVVQCSDFSEALRVLAERLGTAELPNDLDCLAGALKSGGRYASVSVDIRLAQRPRCIVARIVSRGADDLVYRPDPTDHGDDMEYPAASFLEALDAVDAFNNIRALRAGGVAVASGADHWRGVIPVLDLPCGFIAAMEWSDPMFGLYIRESNSKGQHDHWCTAILKRSQERRRYVIYDYDVTTSIRDCCPNFEAGVRGLIDLADDYVESGHDRARIRSLVQRPPIYAFRPMDQIHPAAPIRETNYEPRESVLD